MNFGLVDGLVLVDVADHLLDTAEASVGLSRGLLRQLRLISGVDGVLVGFIGLGGGETNAVLRARIHVLDRLAVAGREFIQFVQPVADRPSLALHIFLAGKRIDAAPAAFAGRWLQRLSGCALGGLISGSSLHSLRGLASRRLVLRI